MAIEVRPGSPADRDAIAAVFLACWRQSYRGILPDRAVDAMTDDRADRLWERVLDSPEGEVLVVERDGAVVGVTRFAVDGATGAVHSLYVSPDAQGLGLGSRLLTEVADRMRRAGAESAALWVFAANAPSIAFYRAQGWTPDGGERTQEEFGEPELRLARSLDGGEDA